MTAEPIEENLVDALLPMNDTAAMQTTAISATNKAYSTKLAPFSELVMTGFFIFF